MNEEYPDNGPTDPWETSGPGRKTDIVSRLRQWATVADDGGTTEDAADEIERLNRTILKMQTTTVWQQIDTAPTTYTPKPFLLWDGVDYVIGWWAVTRERQGWTTGWETAGGYDVGYNWISPTHWMPLPDPPTKMIWDGKCWSSAENV